MDINKITNSLLNYKYDRLSLNEVIETIKIISKQDRNYGELSKQFNQPYGEIGCKNCSIAIEGCISEPKCQFCGESYFD